MDDKEKLLLAQSATAAELIIEGVITVGRFSGGRLAELRAYCFRWGLNCNLTNLGGGLWFRKIGLTITGQVSGACAAQCYRKLLSMFDVEDL